MPSIDFKSILAPFVSGDLVQPENSVWVVYAAVIIETVSSAKHITELWDYVVTDVKEVPDKQLVIARRIREGLLKTSPLAGFPKVHHSCQREDRNLIKWHPGNQYPRCTPLGGQGDISLGVADFGVRQATASRPLSGRAGEARS